MEFQPKAVPASIQLQVDALIAAVREYRQCSKEAAVGCAINLLVERLTDKSTECFGVSMQQSASKPLQSGEYPTQTMLGGSSMSECQLHQQQDISFAYKPLDIFYNIYLQLLQELKLKSSTADPGDVISLKLFSFVAGLHDRYMSPKNYDFGKVLRRVVDSIRYHTNKGPEEDACLSVLRQQIGLEFQLNSKLYYSEGCCGTPDAVQLKAGRVAAIAEFKSTRLAQNVITSKVVNPAKLQLEFTMRATRATTGYLVINMLSIPATKPTSERVKIIKVEPGSCDDKRIRERESMQKRFFEDLVTKKEEQLPKELVELLELNSGGSYHRSDGSSDEWGEFVDDEKTSPNLTSLRKRKVKK